MKIRDVIANNRKRAFEVKTWRHELLFPYAKSSPQPSAKNPVVEVSVDDELGREGFTYALDSGEEGSVHVEQVLEYNRDPAYLRDLVLYRLTLQAKERLEMSPLSKREIVRRLRTSPAQLYRLLDTTDYQKSIDKVLELLSVLDCDVDLVVKEQAATVPSAVSAATRNAGGSRKSYARTSAAGERSRAMVKKTVKYTKAGIGKVPTDKPIMYTIRTEGGRANYIGVAKRGRGQDRLIEHLVSGDAPGATVRVEQFSSIADARRKEQAAIARAQPKYNKRSR